MINNAIVQGRVVYDPDLRQFKSGEKVCILVIASQLDYSNANEGKTWDVLKCEALGNTAEYISRYYKKGSLVNIQGSIKSRRWKDEESGKWHYEQFVHINRIDFAPTNYRKRESDEANGSN